MLVVRNRKQMIFAALSVTLVAWMGMYVHMKVNYEPEFHELVFVRGSIATVTVSFPISLFFMFQMLKNFRLSQELQRLVDRDRLTDVATRDFFFSRMEQHPDAYGVSLMVDIDHFKRINDTYGHIAGDLVIATVARCLDEHTREDDIVCRYGGEEFVLFLYDSQRDEGYHVAERIRRSIAELPIAFEGLDISATVSIGGSLKDRLVDIDIAISAADEALFRAKSEGRNKTVFADDPECTPEQTVA